MGKYAKRKDSNHNAIAETFESVGAYVVDCSHVGAGFPDMLVLWRGAWMLVEVKNGERPKSKRKLTVKQVPLHAEVTRRGGTIYVVESEVQALALLGARRSA